MIIKYERTFCQEIPLNKISHIICYQFRAALFLNQKQIIIICITILDKIIAHFFCTTNKGHGPPRSFSDYAQPTSTKAEEDLHEMFKSYL